MFAVLATLTVSQAFVSPLAQRRRQTSLPLKLKPPGMEVPVINPARTTSRLLRDVLFASPTAAKFEDNHKNGLLDKIVRTFSQSANTKRASPAEVRSEEDRKRVQLLTLVRVGIPSILAGFVAYLLFPAAALTLASSMHDAGVFSVLSQDSSQFVQNFLTVAGLLFSILVGQTCESRSSMWRLNNLTPPPYVVLSHIFLLVVLLFHL